MVIRENDVIISKTRPSRGAISLIDKRFDGFITSTGFWFCSNKKSKSWVHSVNQALRFDWTLKQFEQRCSGGTYPVITQETQIQIAELRDHAYALKKENGRSLQAKRWEAAKAV